MDFLVGHTRYLYRLRMSPTSQTRAFCLLSFLVVACSGGSGPGQPDPGQPDAGFTGQSDAGFTADLGSFGLNEEIPDVTRGFLSNRPSLIKITFTSNIGLGGDFSSFPQFSAVDVRIEGIDNDFLFVDSDVQNPSFDFEPLQLDAGSYVFEVSQSFGSEEVETYTMRLYTLFPK